MNNDSPQDLPPDATHDHRHTRRLSVGWWFFAAIALFYLLSEHRAHFFGALPFLLLLACPLMHLFMHHGHHGHDRPNENKPEENGK